MITSLKEMLSIDSIFILLLNRDENSDTNTMMIQISPQGPAPDFVQDLRLINMTDSLTYN